MCDICKLPCREAQISGCCGSVFCKVCLEKLRELIAAKYSCPHCHSFEFPTFPCKEADQQIKALEVYCPNKNKGCQWTGKLNDIDQHIKDGKRLFPTLPEKAILLFAPVATSTVVLRQKRKQLLVSIRTNVRVCCVLTVKNLYCVQAVKKHFPVEILNSTSPIRIFIIIM